MRALFREGFCSDDRRLVMKLILLLSSATALIAMGAFAQNPPPRSAPVPPPPPARPTASADREGNPVGNPAIDAPRFDLKFSGGPVKEFVASVNKALGKPVNVVIPKDAEATSIPAVEMYRVTVSALFRALGEASQRQIAVRTGSRNVGGRGDQSTYQYQNIGFSFSTNDPHETPDAVWTFKVVSAPELPDDAPVSARVVQYYPVAAYLTHFSVEDITTAIEAGWNLQRETEPNKAAPPTIKFHEETKLLICAGSNRQIDVIPQVLKGLSEMLVFPRTDNLKITRKAKEIIIPKVEFRDATVREALDFIRRKALEIDPQKQGVNILLNEANGPVEQLVSLSLADVPVLEVLKLTAELGKLDLEIRDAAIVLSSSPTGVSAASAGPSLGGGGAASALPPAGAPSSGSFRTPSRQPSAGVRPPPPSPSSPPPPSLALPPTPR